MLSTCSSGPTPSPLLRLALRTALVAGLALPAVGAALPAAATVAGWQGPASLQTPATAQASVLAVEGRCAVRVTLRAGLGERAVVVTARTVAPTVPADRPVEVQDGGRYTAPAGSTRDLALDVDPDLSGTAPHVQVTVAVDGAAAETTELSLTGCTAPPSGAPTTAAPTTAAPTGTASPTPASPSPTAATVTPTPTAAATSSASPTATTTARPTPAAAVPTTPPSATPTAVTRPPSPAAGADPAAPASTGAPGVSGAVPLDGAEFAAGPLTASNLSPLAAPALPGLGVAQLPALAAPGATAGAPLTAPLTAPLPQVAPDAVALFPPALVPSVGGDDVLDLRAAGASTLLERDAVGDLLPAGTALGLAVLALTGLVRRRRA